MSDDYQHFLNRRNRIIPPGRPASAPSPVQHVSSEASLERLMGELASNMRKHEEEMHQKRLEAEEAAYKRRKEEQRETRVWLAKTVIAPLFILVTTVFTQTLTTCNQMKEKDDVPPGVQEVIERSNESIKRVDDLDRKVNQIGTAVVDQQVQLSESVKYLSGKIDAVSVKAQRKEEPEIVKAAAERAEEIKREKNPEDFFRLQGR